MTEQPQMSEGDRIRARKQNVINTLTTKFSEEKWRDRLLKICGGDESKVMKALNSFFTYILNDDGGKENRKAYIADCSMASISTAFLEAFQMGIEVGGGRDHAYLINYAGQCELDISYKGFVFALNKHFDNAFVDARCVFEGDKFDCEITDVTATYTHKPADPFTQTWEKLKGCFCYFSYTLRDGGGKVSRLIMIPRGENDKTPDSLAMIRSKAKGSFAWNDFPFEQCKKATIRRASKIPFASIDFGDEDVNPEQVDNRHYQLEGGDSSNRLQGLLEEHRKLLQDEKKPDEPRKDGQAAKGAAASPTGSDTDRGAAQHPVQDQPADAGAQAPAAGEEAGKEFAQISDADFADAEDGGVIDNAPAPSPAPAGNAVAILPPEETATEWDGKTLSIGGKKSQHDFPTAAAAAVYLKKVIGGRTHKKSRIDIINENPLLIARLVQDGMGSVVTDMHKLASQGA